MSNTGSITISGNTTIANGPSITIGPLTISSTAPINQILELTLTSGENSVTIPTGTKAILIQLPAANAVVTKLMGATSGTAYAITLLAAGGVALFQPAAAQTSFIINASSLHTAATSITFL